MFCNRCGTPIRPGKGFCMNCGAPIAAAPAEPDRRGWSTRWTIAVTFIVLLSAACAVLAFIAFSGRDGVGELIEPKDGEILTGASVELASAAVPPSGGTVTFNQPGDPLDGLTVEVPAGSYAVETGFTVSAAPIEGTTFGPDFDPVSPLISVDNGAGYSLEPMTVRVPVQVSEDDFAMAFAYDEATGSIKGLPTIEAGAGSLTFAAMRGGKAGVFRVSTQRLLELCDAGFRIGFKPGEDDWQFVNHGSVLCDGNCAGQCLSAAWYYGEKARGGANRLFGLYDNNGKAPTPGFWQDDSLAYRLVSVTQADLDYERVDGEIEKRKKAGAWRNYLATAYSLLKTGEPQLLGVAGNQGKHMVLAYAVKGGEIYVADPNQPGREGLTVKVSKDGAVSLDPAGRSYNQVTFYGDWGFLGNRMAERWGQFEAGTIGAGIFPGYRLEVWDEPTQGWEELSDGYDASNGRVKIRVVNTSPAGSELNELLQMSAAVYSGTAELKKDEDGYCKLAVGANPLGIAVNGGLADLGEENNYVDFVRLTVNNGSDHEILHERTVNENTGKPERDYYYYLEDGERVLHGMSTTFWPNGNPMSRFNYKDGVEDGKQEMYYETGELSCVYTCVDGLKQGLYLTYYPDGVLRSEEQMKDDKPEEDTLKYYDHP